LWFRPAAPRGVTAGVGVRVPDRGDGTSSGRHLYPPDRGSNREIRGYPVRTSPAGFGKTPPYPPKPAGTARSDGELHSRCTPSVASAAVGVGWSPWRPH